MEIPTFILSIYKTSNGVDGGRGKDGLLQTPVLSVRLVLKRSTHLGGRSVRTPGGLTTHPTKVKSSF